MKDWNPKGLWDELRRAFGARPEDDDDERTTDPALLFHLTFTAPLVIGLLLLARLA